MTALDIFIGIAAVVVAIILTQGASTSITNQVSGIADTVLILPGTASTNGVTGGAVSTLTEQDMQSLATLPHSAAISSVLTIQEQIIYGNQNWSTQVQSVNTDELNILNQQVQAGSWFSESDDSSGATIVVLGDAVKHGLFDASGVDPLGQQIRIQSQTFRVVGILAAQGGGDDVVYIPFHTIEALIVCLAGGLGCLLD